jgi:beta-N-acetylhexosaminidase
MHIRPLFTGFVLVLTFLTAVAQPAAAKKPVSPKPHPAKKIFPVNDSWVESTLSRMTVPEKIGQMIVASADAVYVSSTDNTYLRLSRLAREGKIGGVMFLKGNIFDAGLLANHFQSVSALPLLISADMERGLAMRLEGATEFSPAMALAATGNPELARSMAKVIAREARAAGIHQCYGPTVDLNINPSNPIINTRSFGDSIPLAISMSSTIIDELESDGIVATVKHFPGHGDVTVDSHHDLPVLEGDRQRLAEYELKPFKAAIDQGVISVMVGHLAVPKLTGSLEPASISKTITTDLLRGELDFKGLVITDAMNMKGIYNGSNLKEISVKAVQAGNDILLFPPDPETTFFAVLAAVEDGSIPVSRIDDSVRRILRVKRWLGLDKEKMIDLTRLKSQINQPEDRRLAEKIAECAITLVRDRNGFLPLRTPDANGTMLNIIVQDKASEANGKSCEEMLGREFSSVTVRLNPSSSDEAYKTATDLAAKASSVIITTTIQTYSPTGPSKLSRRQIEFLNALPDMAAQRAPVILVLFGTPYLIEAFPNIGTVLCTFGANEYSESSAVNVLKGNLKPKGKLPISLRGAQP